MLDQGCPSCCSSCISKLQSRPCATPNVLDPLSFAHLLPAGMIVIPTPAQRDCLHLHAEDGWHPFTYVAGEEDQLAFLIDHKFVSATCRLAEDKTALIVRIYIVPYDLANYGGKLRNRDETKVVAPARKYLKALLPRIIQDRAIWDGRTVTASSPAKLFLPSPVVCEQSPRCGVAVDLKNLRIPAGQSDNGRIVWRPSVSKVPALCSSSRNHQQTISVSTRVCFRTNKQRGVKCAFSRPSFRSNCRD
jgi:hypothetical protein